jgi:hypothetical protein
MSDPGLVQPMLFEFSDTATSVVELFPAVWGAVEGLTAPDVDIRHQSLDQLLEWDAPRISPLVAYVLASRIIDSDLTLRFRVVQTIGDVFSSKDINKIAPVAVRQHLRAYLSQMTRRGILCLLEVSEHFPAAESQVASMLNACPQAGSILAEIMADRRLPLTIRKQAIHYIGRVGFLDAVSALKRMEERLVSRMNGQKAMPFAPPGEPDQVSLLPAIQVALTMLREP